MQIKKVEEKPMQIHVKEKIKVHKVEKATPELQDGKVKLISKTKKTDNKVTGKGNMVAEHKLKEQKAKSGKQHNENGYKNGINDSIKINNRSLHIAGTIAGRKAMESQWLDIKATSYYGDDIEIKQSNLVIEEDWNKVGEHKFVVELKTDANYELAINYTNKAGYNVKQSYKYTVDNSAPETFSIGIENNNAWADILDKLTFGVWKNYSVTVKATATDLASGVNNICYYKSNDKSSILNWNYIELIQEKADVQWKSTKK